MSAPVTNTPTCRNLSRYCSCHSLLSVIFFKALISQSTCSLAIPFGPATPRHWESEILTPASFHVGTSLNTEESKPRRFSEETPSDRTFPARILSLIHISEPTRLGMISYAVF